MNIGGGFGSVSAAGAAGLGAKVALIERSLMGGDCLNVGCVPSKGIISAGRIAATIRNTRRFGIEVPDGMRVDFPAVMERMRKLRAQISPNDSAQRFQTWASTSTSAVPSTLRETVDRRRSRQSGFGSRG